MSEYLDIDWQGIPEDKTAKLTISLVERPDGKVEITTDVHDKMPTDIQLELMFSWLFGNWIQATSRQCGCGIEKAMELAIEKMSVMMPSMREEENDNG